MATETMTKSGGCLCGAVRFDARDVPARVLVCHCPSCQRWMGSALFEVSVPEGSVDWTGDFSIYTSSDWGERAFCKRCGAGLYYRTTDGSEWAGTYDIPVGLFDTQDCFEITHEIYADHAIVALAEQGQKRLTRADCVKLNPRLDQ